MSKSPQQAIYDTIFATSLKLGYSTYPYLPAKDVAYPFVFMGEQFDNDIETKTHILGLVNQTIHIYHDYKKRRELTDMMNALKREIRNLKRAENYRITVRSINGRTLPDNTTGERLWHGIIEVEIRFS